MSRIRERVKENGNVIALLLAVILFSATLGFLSAGINPSGPAVVMPGTQYLNVAYVMFADSGTYYSRNGVTGIVSALTADPSISLNSLINATAEGHTIGIVGDITFTSPIILLRKVNLEFDGMLTASGTDWLRIGDSTHWVQGAKITFNELDCVNRAHNGIVFRQTTAIQVEFTKIKRCNVALYFDPVGGTGAGENMLYGGWLTANNYGIDFNPNGTGNWAQGNRFYASIYASYDAGIRITGHSGYGFQSFSGTIDSIVGIDPNYPSAGGGYAIYDTIGNSMFFIVWPYLVNGTVVLGPHSWVSTQQDQPVTAVVMMDIGLSSTYLHTPQMYVSSQHRYYSLLNFQTRFGGTFASGEQLSIAMQCTYYNLTIGPTLYVNASANSITTTLPAGNYFDIAYITIWADTNKASTNTTIISSFVFGE